MCPHVWECVFVFVFCIESAACSRTGIWCHQHSDVSTQRQTKPESKPSPSYPQSCWKLWGAQPWGPTAITHTHTHTLTRTCINVRIHTQISRNEHVCICAHRSIDAYIPAYVTNLHVHSVYISRSNLTGTGPMTVELHCKNWWSWFFKLIFTNSNVIKLKPTAHLLL